MILLKWKDLKNNNFTSAVSALLTAKHPVKLGRLIFRIHEGLIKEQVLANEQFRKLVNKYGDVDPEDNYKIRDENMEIWQTELKEFLEIDFKIYERKISVRELDHVSTLTAIDSGFLTPLLNDLEILEGGKNGEEEISEKNQENDNQEA